VSSVNLYRLISTKKQFHRTPNQHPILKLHNKLLIKFLKLLNLMDVLQQALLAEQESKLLHGIELNYDVKLF
jgi:hypothetical protein